MSPSTHRPRRASYRFPPYAPESLSPRLSPSAIVVAVDAPIPAPLPEPELGDPPIGNPSNPVGPAGPA